MKERTQKALTIVGLTIVVCSVVVAGIMLVMRVIEFMSIGLAGLVF